MTDTIEQILSITFTEEAHEDKCERHVFDCPNVAVWEIRFSECKCGNQKLCDPCLIEHKTRDPMFMDPGVGHECYLCNTYPLWFLSLERIKR